MVWTLKGNKGEYVLDFRYNEKSYIQELKISDKQEYIKPIKTINKGNLKQIRTIHPKLTPFGDFSIFGWNPGWFATYILFSILFSTILRKFLKVY